MPRLSRWNGREVHLIVMLRSVVWLALLVVLGVEASTTVFFRKRVQGNIFALGDSTDASREIELEGTANASRFVALALSTDRVYWSDHRSIRSALSSNGTDIRTEIGTLIRVRWFGVNFDSGGLQLSVMGIPCASVVLLDPTTVECFVGIPLVDAKPTASDCFLLTDRGGMQGVALNRYDEMRANGLSSPVVERIDIRTTPVAPQALAIDGDHTLIWSNAADGIIYRSSLKDTAIYAIQAQAWDVKGLALLRWSHPVQALEVLFSIEGSGFIRRARVSPDAVNQTETLLSDLRSPRGLAIDPNQNFLYFTEKTGRIFRASLLELLPMGQALATLLPEPQLLITLSALSRLDGIAVDESFLYWCEANSNVVARAYSNSFEREIFVGGSPDATLSWPRSIALRFSSGMGSPTTEVFYTEYTGRISKGKSEVIVNELNSPSLKYLDELLQSKQSDIYFYALE